MATDARTSKASGSLDLGKELTCSICTDILYQPLTVLDCLHTFCGSCLKEWFGWQGAQYEEASRRSRSSKIVSPFTCPSCRATVRETRPNATVTTLLEMHLQAHPEQAKSQEDREEIAKSYKAGDTVMPTIRVRRRNDAAEEEDERQVEEARQISLQEAQSGPTSRRTRERSEERQRRRGEEQRVRTGGQTHNSGEPERGTSTGREQSRPQDGGQRQIGHQSSLRSLLSVSDLHTQGMEEEIMRQIVEEGLLEGIDLENIDAREEEEISERIAQAYRRHRRERSTQSTEATTSEISRSGRDSAQTTPRIRQEGDRQIPHTTTDSRPPLSRPHLIDAASNGRREHTRSSSQDSNRLRPASAGDSRARSAERLEGATSGESRESRPRQLSEDNRRSNTDPSPNRISDMWRRGAAGVSPQLQNQSTMDPETTTRSQPASPPPTVSSVAASSTGQTDPPRIDGTKNSRPKYSEPLINCSSCQKPHIQYDLHYKCPKCVRDNKNVTLCLRCYRLGKGCDHWYGFGYAARARYDRQAPPTGYPYGHEPPHIMQPQRYRRPPTPGGPVDSTLSPDPAKRLQRGVFCDNCFQNANSCFWHCNICNDGEWGFCHNCINKAQHCTHSLLALTYFSPTPTTTTQDPTMSDPQEKAEPMIVTLVPMVTSCNICTLHIPPTHTRFHCPTCPDGDYDICTSCYHSLVTSNRISTRDGPMGWRKCPSGHRMLVIGFEGREVEGLRRYVVHEVVGGWALPEEEANDAVLKERHAKAQADGGTERWSWRDDKDGNYVHSRHPSRYVQAAELPVPESGGSGLRMIALWNRAPDEDARDEIMFPRGAEVREAVDINGDWCWGVYCRKGGLFPGGYCRAVR